MEEEEGGERKEGWTPRWEKERYAEERERERATKCTHTLGRTRLLIVS